jgi:hypothetical protein
MQNTDHLASADSVSAMADNPSGALIIVTLQQSFGSSGLPFPSAKAKQAPLEHTTLPAVALFCSPFLSMLSRSDACDSGQCAGPMRRLSRRQET